MRWNNLYVLNSRVACLQLPQWTIFTTIPVVLVHMTRSMELGYPSSNIQMTLSLGFSGMLLPIQTTLSERGPKRKAAQLPDTYANVPHVALLRHDPPVPKDS